MMLGSLHTYLRRSPTPTTASPGTTARGTVVRRLLLLLVASAVASATAASPAAAQDDAGQRHMLWEISSEQGTEGYLVGSVHLMKPDAYPLGEAYDRAFESADVLAFEVNLDSLQSNAMSLFQRYGLYQGGQTLQGQLPDSTYAILQQEVSELGVPLARLQSFEPWAVSLTVTSLQLRQAGYSGQSGIDRHFFDRAKEADKGLASLETAEEQIKFFDELPPEQQATYLHQSLREADRALQQVDEIVRHWKAGEAEQATALIQGEMRDNYPELYETLIVQRNGNWMPQMTRMLESDRVPMFVVGLGHVSGPDGLVGMLREEGYSVRQR